MQNSSPNIILSTLQKAGLNDKEAEVYLYLLQHGKTGVLELIKNTNNKRGNLYHILYSLRDHNLVGQSTDKGKLHFELKDPHFLRDLLEKQRQQLTQTAQEVESALPDLLSQFTLTSHKPNIILFEGEEAQQRILEDSLSSVGDILQYVDLETVMNLYPDINQLYAKRRARMKKKKRIILSDTPAHREYAVAQNPTITEVRLIDFPLPQFGTLMQIYNDKVSYLTLKPESMIGTIVQEPQIAEMHRSFFEYIWQQAYAASGNS